MALPPDLTRPLLSPEELEAELLHHEHPFGIPRVDLQAVAEGLSAEGARVAADLNSGQRPRWQITDKGGAEWAMRQVADARRVEAETDRLAKDFHSQVDDWAADVVGPRIRTARFFEHHLTDYLRRLQAAEPDESKRPKSLKLPSGSVTSRTPTKPSVEVVKPDELDGWVFRRFAEAVASRVREALSAQPDAPLPYEAALAIDTETLAAAIYDAAQQTVVRFTLEAAKAGINEAATVVPDPTWPETAEADAPLVVVIDGEVVPGLAGAEPETTYTVKPAL